MTLPHRLPTVEERETLEPFDITTPHAWEPKDFITPGSSIAYANLILSSNMHKHLKGLDDLTTLGDSMFGIYPGMKGDTKFFNALYASRHQTSNTPMEPVHSALLGNEFYFEKSHDQFLTDLQPIIPDDPENPHDVSQYPRMVMNMKKSITPKIKKTHKIQNNPTMPSLCAS